MAPLADPLLGGSEHLPQRSPLTKALLLSGALLGLALGACGLLHRAGTSRGSLGGFRPPLNTTLVDWSTRPCVSFTGGTCLIHNCNAERKASCVTGLCTCASGCVDASGNCESDDYELVASNIMLRNVKYNEYLYTPRTWFMNQLRVTSKAGSYADRWNVFRVPGTAYGKKYHIISPVEYPTYATSVSGDSSSVGQLSATKVIVVDMSANVQNPWDLFQYVCKSSLHPGAWEISNLHDGGNGVKWYVHHGSWEVFGYFFGALATSWKVGESGEWMPVNGPGESGPAVDLSLPRCE